MSFDTLAPFYRPMEAVLAGRIMQRCRTSFLAEAVGRRRALILGEGPGRFLIELLRSTPGIEVTIVEKSPAMIRQALSRIRKGGFDPSRIAFREMDALTWEPSGRVFDLIVTHFFLDCFRPEELTDLVGRLRDSSTEGARWLLGDFCIPQRGWRRFRARAIHAAMYACFRAATGLSARRLTSPDAYLQGAGFQLAERRFFNFGLIHSDLWIKFGA
jgi:SAM-dependent methyltransferase